MLKALYCLLIISFIFQNFSTSVDAATYYVAPDVLPNGVIFDDSSSSNIGTKDNPFTSFQRLWRFPNNDYDWRVQRGDVIILLDGVFKEALIPIVPADDGRTITIKALNEGKSVIDGEGKREVVQLNNFYPQWGTRLTIEGIVAMNSINTVYNIRSNNNVLRRISGYNGNVDTNDFVLLLNGGKDNLVEDCVMGGTGRKIINLFGAQNSIIRRCFASWMWYRGATYNGEVPQTPECEGIQLYHGTNNILENNINFGRCPGPGISGHANDLRASLVGNKIYGNASVYTARHLNSSEPQWLSVSPFGVPMVNACASFFRCSVGFDFHGQGKIVDNHVKDLFVYGSGGAGIIYFPQAEGYVVPEPLNDFVKNNVIENSTSLNNFLGSLPNNVSREEREGRNPDFIPLTSLGLTYQNIKTTDMQNNSGAKLQNMYVDGALTSVPLWPWPMEDRVNNEFKKYFTSYFAEDPVLQNFSVTKELCEKILLPNGAVRTLNDCYAGGPIPTVFYPTISPEPTVSFSIYPTLNPSINPLFDVNKDGKVNLLDVISVINEIFK